MTREETPDMFCTHEEADTRMFFHLAGIIQPKNVVIRTADTDCLIIALANRRNYHVDTKIWLEVGTQTANTLRYINVNLLELALGDLVGALPAFHALTGCDYTASFCRKAKIRPLKQLEKREDLQMALASLGTESEDCDETMKKIEEYVCLMYGRKKCVTVNEARLEIFLQKYKTCKKLSAVKKLDAGMLPPCLKVLRQKVKRTRLVARRWNSSTLQHQPIEVPEENGWILEDEKYKIKWFEGEESPDMLDVVKEDCEGNLYFH